jgi:hypothetical protein
VNHLDACEPLVRLLNAASAQIFVMANHSDDPIAGAYGLPKERVVAIESQIRKELDSRPS